MIGKGIAVAAIWASTACYACASKNQDSDWAFFMAFMATGVVSVFF